MALLAAFQLLLSRYTGQDDVSVGSPIAGRRHAEAEALIGFFVNTLVLRTRLSSARRFRELLAQVRDVTLAAYENQDVPFEKLVEELRPARSLSRSPLFQVVLTLQNTPTPPPGGQGPRLRPLEVERRTAKFELNLSLSETPAGFLGGLEYNTDLFDASTVTRLVSHLRAVLQAVTANPDLAPTDVPLLSAEERHQLLVEWSGATPTDYPRDTALPALFEAQVERSPGCGGPALRRAAAHLPRAQPARQPARAPPARAPASAPGIAVALLRGALAGDGGGLARVSSRRAAPTSRWIPRTRASGSPSCWRTPPPRCC